MRIVIVDDHRDSAELLGFILESRGGHDVALYFDGTSAIRHADEMRADIGILDLGLPDMSGQALASQLLAKPSCARMCLIALSGSTERRDREAARAAGFTAYLVKPLRTDELFRVLDECRRLRDLGDLQTRAEAARTPQ
jgi:DNA-binding response OmpR family regulator